MNPQTVFVCKNCTFTVLGEENLQKALDHAGAFHQVAKFTTELLQA